MLTGLLKEPYVSSHLLHLIELACEQPTMVITGDMDEIKGILTVMVGHTLQERGLDQAKIIIAAENDGNAEILDTHLTHAIDIDISGFGLIMTKQGGFTRNQLYKNAPVILGPVYQLVKDVKQGLCPGDIDLAILIGVETAGKYRPYKELMQLLIPKNYLALASFPFTSRQRQDEIQRSLRITKVIEREQRYQPAFIAPVYVTLSYEYITLLRWLRDARESFGTIINRVEERLEINKMSVKSVLALKSQLEKNDASGEILEALGCILHLFLLENQIENLSPELALDQFIYLQDNPTIPINTKILANAQVLQVEEKLRKMLSKTESQRKKVLIHPKMITLRKMIDEFREKDSTVCIITSQKRMVEILTLYLSDPEFKLPSDIVVGTVGQFSIEALEEYDRIILYDMGQNPRIVMNKLQNITEQAKMYHIITKNSRDERLHHKFISTKL